MIVVAAGLCVQLAFFAADRPIFVKVRNQLSQFQDRALTSTTAPDPTKAVFSAATENNVSVVITSSLIPIHPSLTFINSTIQSLRHLEGLPTDTPIYVTVDGMKRVRGYENFTIDKQRRNKYIDRLSRASFYPFTNVNVLAMRKHRHIAGSVLASLEVIANQTHSTPFLSAASPTPDSFSNHFVYLLQHDLVFNATIPHGQLLQAMQQNPTELKNVRFRYNRPGPRDISDLWDLKRFPHCREIRNGSDFVQNGLNFFPTARWSDNNQVSTLAYYQDMFRFMKTVSKRVDLDQPMEWIMMAPAAQNCTRWGQAVLGDRVQRLSYLGHLDGRNTRTE